ncbi:MAG TPA: DUF4389 domain-containing protein [Rhodocyclaceae bacterium]|nr:DUF4389 domain-containing protein [Rhodocyclaceae bacterium]
MEPQSREPNARRSLLIRALLMLLLGLAYQLAGTVLFVVAVIQFCFSLLGDAPNARLASFGRGLGRYQAQNVDFLSFASEDLPFPFSDWPS